MLRSVLEELAALVSVSLFVSMIAVWAIIIPSL